MRFEKELYQVEKITVGNDTIEVRAFRNRIYVDKPVQEEFQQMNVFAPETYYQGGTIHGYSLHTAPIFMPNLVGGYMPGMAGEPVGMPWEQEGIPNTIFRALQHGYVVATPAIRGRVLQNASGEYIGKAPACVVDYKAAVRYLRHFAKELPGDTEKIITNGTSAGGALSSLMGATGNHPDYEGYLEEIGAAKERDDIFAASCYCPITNLEHADMAHEWQFLHVNHYHRMHMRMDEGGRPAFTQEDGQMSELQIKASEELAKRFPDYVNSLKLRDENGALLELDAEGNGSFKEYMKRVVLASAQRALDFGAELSDKKWLIIRDGVAVAMDWQEYVRDITRMKSAPAFDALSMDSPENDLFGSGQTNMRHFTEYSRLNSLTGGEMAEDGAVKRMNPMKYLEDNAAVKARHWRIRHGECDRDTSLAISAMLALKLKEISCEVDYHSPWNVLHAGDYDLEELFAWVDEIAKS
ncbi:MAG: alpha/beta hydrolase [Lachnospiraceae bacterium]|nr:alpha/beta hydrolase [Lachnospiraceae bacterium]